MRPTVPKVEAKAGEGFLGRGRLTPSPPAMGSWERCKLPQRGLGWSTRSQTFLLNFDCCVWPLVVLKPGCHGGRPTVSTCTCKLLYRCLGSEWRVHIDRRQWQWIALLLSDTKILHDKHFVQYCHTSILTCNCDLIVIVHCVSLCLKKCHYFVLL